VIGAITAGLFGAGVPPVTSSYESIATVSVGGAGAASISFSSIPSTYKHLQIRFIARGLSGGAIYTRLNSDTGSNYSSHNINGDGSTAGVNSQVATSQPLIIRNGGISTTANIFSAGVIDLLDYTDTNKNSVLRSLAGQDLNGSGMIEFASNAWYNTAAVTNITMTHNGSGFAQYSQFALYGIKG
jgi:hypothetical protein